MTQNEDMTLRDYFAGQALQGLLSNSSLRFDRNDDSLSINYARTAYRLADAMLRERKA